MIGIISRKDYTPSKKEAYITYKSINDVIINNNETGVGILPNELDKIKDVIGKCDGIILEGGDYFTILDLEIIKYIYDQDIPCLGICLGMQSMAYLFDGRIGSISNHQSNSKYVHDVIIKNSNIYPDKTIKVNSRHKDYVICTSLSVTGYSSDTVIEMVEDKNKTFFVGVEWHPENMVDYDSDANLLFDKFFNATKYKKSIEK